MTTNNHSNRSIITSCSNKFFPSFLNLIGSIKKHHPDHPHIYVYNLGLFPTYQMEIKSMKGVTLVEMPEFCSFWRKCYTWKTYIFTHPFTDVTLYLDAGNELLKPLLSELFNQIERDGYLAVEQTIQSKFIIPKDYISLFNIPADALEKNAITAGIFGFDRRNSNIQNLLSRLHDASLAGLCLGFSQSELWKNKKPNDTFFVRDCPRFRHDTTLLTILAHTLFPDLKPEQEQKFGGLLKDGKKSNPDQVIWNLRMSYDSLDNINPEMTSSSNKFSTWFNRVVIRIFFSLKKVNKIIKTYLFNKNIFSAGFGNELSTMMDSFHTYPGGKESSFSNVRLYHHQKALIAKTFINKNSSQTKVFLDAGAGTGPYSKIASGSYQKVFAYEYDKQELERAKENLKDAENIEFAEVDLKKIPLQNSSIDVFVCSEVLEHIKDEHIAAKELFRVLKVGGTGLLSMPNKNSLFYRNIKSLTLDLLKRYDQGDELTYNEWERIRHISFSSHDIEKIATDSGFKIIKRYGANIIPLPTNLRKFLMTRLPFFFYLWIVLERKIASILPRFCSFYFIELKK